MVQLTNVSLTLEESLRLGEVKRWGIVAISRAQSVAEHTAIVAHTALELASMLGVFQTDWEQAKLMKYALFHDAPEIYTGDIPAPTKKLIDQDDLAGAEERLCPAAAYVADDTPSAIKQLVKVADAWEGYVFAVYYATGPQSKRVKQFMFQYMNDMIRDFSESAGKLSDLYDGVDSGSVADLITSHLLCAVPGVRPNAD